jgi:hypothetical protein
VIQQLCCVMHPRCCCKMNTAVSYPAHNVTHLRFIKYTRSVLHHTALYVCLQSPVDATLKVVVNILERTKADSVIAGMLPALYGDQLANPFLGINDKCEVACWSFATMFGTHEHQVARCHPIWNIHNAL